MCRLSMSAPGKELDIEVIIPVEDMGNLAGQDLMAPNGGTSRGSGSIWPSVHPRLLELILAHQINPHLHQCSPSGRDGSPAG